MNVFSCVYIGRASGSRPGVGKRGSFRFRIRACWRKGPNLRRLAFAATYLFALRVGHSCFQHASRRKAVVRHACRRGPEKLDESLSTEAHMLFSHRDGLRRTDGRRTAYTNTSFVYVQVENAGRWVGSESRGENYLQAIETTFLVSPSSTCLCAFLVRFIKLNGLVAVNGCPHFS